MNVTTCAHILRVSQQEEHSVECSRKQTLLGGKGIRPRPLFLCSLPPPPPPTYKQHQPEALHGQGAKSASQQVGGLGRAGPLTLTWCLRGWAFLSANCPHCAHPTPSTQPPNRRMSVPVTPSEKTHISQVLKAHSVSKKLKTRTRIISQTYKACVLWNYQPDLQSLCVHVCMCVHVCTYIYVQSCSLEHT